MKRFLQKKHLQQGIFAAILLSFLFQGVTYAEESGLELEGTLTTMLKFLEGRMAYFVGVGSIILATAGWAASEGGSTARSGFKIAMALAIMFNAATLAGKLFSATKGMGM